MDVKDFLEDFNITASESQLRILTCSPKTFAETKNIKWVDQNQLSHLPFEDQSFNLALCREVLFINPSFSESFHLEALMELSRVATEVRVSPLMDANGLPSVYLGPVLQVLQEKGYGVELKEIKSKNAKDKQALLRLWNPSCAVQVSTKNRG